MSLRSDFQGLRGSILHRTPLPNVDSVVHELIVEEAYIKSWDNKGFKTTTNPTIFVVAQRSQNSNQNHTKFAFDMYAFCKRKTIGNLSFICRWTREINSNNKLDHLNSFNLHNKTSLPENPPHALLFLNVVHHNTLLLLHL